MIVTSMKAWPAQESAFHPVIRQALAFLAQNDFQDFVPGKIDLIPGRLFCLLQEMDSVPFEEARPESHRQFIDIQYLISGHERMGVSRVESDLHTVVDDRTPQQDIMFWQVEEEEIQVTLTPGMFAIFFPQDIHRPCCHPQSGGVNHLRKAVVKIDRALLEETV
ncbi:YhcH/YjgK/YiaL family protein [Kosakonia radicincitans]|uniref:YhcH/YjgK/YiaL family protein n=1 Tax=Kosakonia radicincitans TaxID=283686 RepID=A0AAX2EL05_9ENTR|nr:YhcH/YjgK/YiaL family protein [Kosakonia radicincitans]MDP9565287.1 YhcH/YjgK/YiaL family protein [Kosakonia oryzae]SET15877.1 YhcH/YjgK/YiaL family protein [Kosakonia radicincitans]SFD85918.1 YhcH/YjgK/YiaL family protein [Kosakonia radicincitans]SFQ95202.1 YhcH/YjgK/YiaL family protein [Kosakonia radicincitans]SFT34762.1 YhcH/YjgK/YiaL family protein [Kosakonia radicincitans]